MAKAINQRRIIEIIGLEIASIIKAREPISVYSMYEIIDDLFKVRIDFQASNFFESPFSFRISVDKLYELAKQPDKSQDFAKEIVKHAVESLDIPRIDKMERLRMLKK